MNTANTHQESSLINLFVYMRISNENLCWKLKSIPYLQNVENGTKRGVNKLYIVYKLLEVLHNEIRLISLICKQISYQAVNLRRRKKTEEKQARITALWDAYDEGNMTNEEFLSAASAFTAF